MSLHSSGRPDTDEVRVRTSLQEAAGRVEPPPPDLRGLRDGGRRQARRRTGTVVLAAAAAVAVIVGGVALAEREVPAPVPAPVTGLPDHPRSIGDLPRGDLPRLGYVANGQVVAGSTSNPLDLELGALRYGGDVVMSWADGTGVVRFDGKGGYDVVDPTATGYPAISPDGHWAAWQVVRPGQDARVRLWDLSTGAEVDTVAVPERPECCSSGFHVAGVDPAGRVYVTGDQAQYVVEAGAGRVTPLKGVSATDDTVTVAADGVVVTSPPTEKGGELVVREGVVDGSGRLAGGTTLSANEVVGRYFWSPYDSGRYLLAGSSGLFLEDFDAGPRAGQRRIALPPDVEVADVAWESRDAVLVALTEGRGAHWVRCLVDAGGCEIAADLGDVTTFEQGGVILPTW
ncbi:hypothetical protein [Nocardioides mesophilus]|uniref:WD40 repeat domain-containing protein n=1 Tax=Nocardioides mesophilus TaxID=433659 RepID=A0A7G9RG14_9ACTN|nr:hypothetical protein [Nocardioides mesophilus]QNN54539.1 hypothetical protein H9L09_09640 [Nocardioides mesophilus]